MKLFTFFHGVLNSHSLSLTMYLNPLDYDDTEELDIYPLSRRNSELEYAKQCLQRGQLDIGLKSVFRAFYYCDFEPQLRTRLIENGPSLWELTFEVNATWSDLLFCY